MSKREVPGQARDNNERLANRPYESDFAKMPSEEVHPRTTPGAGPHGTVSGGPTNLPLVVIAVGALIAFTGFGLGPVAMVLGLAVVVIGAVWAGVRSTTTGGVVGAGLGTTTVDESDEQHRRDSVDEA
jgi:hypothetical protein